MRKYAQECPVARTLDLIGDRWTMIIIRDLFMGSTRFADFRERSPGMPPKVLSARLKMLLDEEIIERQVYSEHPLRAGYHLTEKGRSLLPIILEIGNWGFENLFGEDPELRAGVAQAISERIPEARARLKEYIDG